MEGPIEGRLIEFLTKDKTVLNGFLLGSEKWRTCMIYVHGMTGNFYGGSLQFSIAERIGRRGISLFSMNTRGHDAVSVIRKRKGREIERSVGGTDVERFEDSASDIEAAIIKLKSLGFEEFILAGHSTGCQKVTYYQSGRMDKSVKGILLLAPADDRAIQKKGLGRKFDSTVRRAKTLIRQGRGDDPTGQMPWHFSPKRFLSLVDTKNVEARLFDYDGPMDEFSRINTQICAVFGSKEEYASKPVTKYLKILREKTGSGHFVGVVVDNARHSFRGYEEVVADFVVMWLNSRGKAKVPTHEIIELNSKFPLALLGYS